MRNRRTQYRVFFDFSRNKKNHHGTQKAGEAWNKETVRGPKVVFLDVLEGNKGMPTRAVFYKRVILYWPSGAWWYFDVCVRRDLVENVV